MQIGKLARSRIDLDDGPFEQVYCTLMRVVKCLSTHTGFELTLLLDGEFSDEDGHYVPGDFMMLDGRHNHTPKTIEGACALQLLVVPYTSIKVLVNY